MAKPSDHLYHITYSIHFNDKGLTSAEIMALGEDFGGCDALIITSIIFPEDGSYDQKIVGVNGVEKRSLTTREMWKAWAVMAGSLLGSLELAEWQGELVRLVHEKTRDHVLAARRSNGEDI